MLEGKVQWNSNSRIVKHRTLSKRGNLIQNGKKIEGGFQLEK